MSTKTPENQTPQSIDEARRKILIDLVLISMTLVAIISIFPYGETENGLPIPPARPGLTGEVAPLAKTASSAPLTGETTIQAAASPPSAGGPADDGTGTSKAVAPGPALSGVTGETTADAKISPDRSELPPGTGDESVKTAATGGAALGEAGSIRTPGPGNPSQPPDSAASAASAASTGEVDVIGSTNEAGGAGAISASNGLGKVSPVKGAEQAAGPAETSAGALGRVSGIPTGPRVREGIRAYPETLNPLLARDSESLKVTTMVFSGLLVYGRDLFLKGDLAESWEISEDRRKVKFTLKPAKWHDGTDVTSLDVKATFDFIWKNRERCPRAEDFTQVAQVVALDGRTVRVDYKKAFARLVDIWTIPILKAGSVNGESAAAPARSNTAEAEQGSAAKDANPLPVGSGPFRVRALNPPNGITLEAFENYHFGVPEIKGYEFRILRGDEETVGAIAKGEVDMVELPFGLQVRQGLGGGIVESFPSNDCEWLLFNTGNQKLRSKELRQCLSMAIDTSAITATVPGGATRLSGPFLSTSWAADPSIQPPPPSMQKAQERLANLGQPLPADINILTDSGNSWRVAAARKIAEAWRQLGIEASVSPIPWNMLVNRVTSRNYEAALIGFELDVDPDPYSLWHSSSTIGGLNVTGFASPEADVLIEKGRECFLTDERQEAYRTLHKLILAEAPCVFLFTPARRICLGPRFRTAIFTRTGTRVDMHKWTARLREGGIE